MAIEFKCECGETLLASEELAGKRGRCPSCQRIIRAPEARPERSEFEEIIIEVEREEPESPKEGLDISVELEKTGSKIGRGSFKSSPKGFLTRFPKPLSLGIPAAVLALFASFLIMRSAGQKSERLGDTLETREKLSATEESSPLGVPEESAERISVSQRKPETEAVREDLAEEERPIQFLPDEVYAPEGESVVLPPAEEKESQVIPEKETQEKAPSPKRQAKLDETGQLARVRYTVNLGAFREKARADRYVQKLRREGLDVFGWVTEGSGKRRWYLVSIGKFSTLEQAKLFAKDLEKQRELETDVVKLPTAQD